MNLEKELRAALQREEPPAGFRTEVLRRVRSGPRRHQPPVWAIAAAIGALAIVPSAYQYRRHQRAIQARDQLVTALSITRAQLEHTREKLLQNTGHRQ